MHKCLCLEGEPSEISVDSFAIAAWIIFTVLRRCVQEYLTVLEYITAYCVGLLIGVRVHYGVFSTLCSGIFDGVYGVGLF